MRIRSIFFQLIATIVRASKAHGGRPWIDEFIVPVVLSRSGLTNSFFTSEPNRRANEVSIRLACEIIARHL